VPDGLGVASRGRRVDRALLEAFQAPVHATPAGADEVDEEREIVHPGMALGEQVAFEPLEPPDGLVEQASNLGDVPRDRQYLGAQPIANGAVDASRNRGLELGCSERERLHLNARALERRFQHCRFGTACGCLGDPLLCSFQGEVIHGRRGYSQRRMDTALLDYELPAELIAQRPVEPRDASRLLVLRRATGEIEHRVFSELPELLTDEVVVVNDTRVVPARLRLHRATGGRAEVLLVERVGDSGLWEGLVRPTARLRPGERLGPVELVEPLGGGRWLLRLDGEPEGEAPLPPYIHEPLADAERYQTVYARAAGSAAAPTAGLHLTPGILDRLDPATVTLHVGLDTFRPVVAATLEEHELHGERYEVDSAEWERIAGAGRVLAVGTTTVRTLETVARTGELSGRTTLFVTPGFEFRRVDALLTNFHLPRSTLLALVMAFVGVERTLETYRVAIAERYRFYSFGDAMLAL
jgi:S-adenosylmethionine:tRNA ribosyltransferase-isomerase